MWMKSWIDTRVSITAVLPHRYYRIFGRNSVPLLSKGNYRPYFAGVLTDDHPCDIADGCVCVREIVCVNLAVACDLRPGEMAHIVGFQPPVEYQIK